MPDPHPAPPDFAGFYRATLAPLRRYLARLLGSRMEAQDLAHDAYARVYPAMREGQVGSPQAFLYTTARRLAINRLRHRDRARTDSVAGDRLEGSATPAPGVAQTVIAREELDRLERALAQLPPGCRAVLLLRKVEMLPHDAIARRLGVSRSNVEKQHVRALRLLREILEAEAAVEPAGADPARRRTAGKDRP